MKIILSYYPNLKKISFSTELETLVVNLDENICFSVETNGAYEVWNVYPASKEGLGIGLTLPTNTCFATIKEGFLDFLDWVDRYPSDPRIKEITFD